MALKIKKDKDTGEYILEVPGNGWHAGPRESMPLNIDDQVNRSEKPNDRAREKSRLLSELDGVGKVT